MQIVNFIINYFDLIQEYSMLNLHLKIVSENASAY
jgi:hypothetical protein